ncbi:regulatory protein RecX [Luteipulveratus halotolerans]|uniref:regulatory protein RecX n=1 Tax=Luteipulveratus halotolerans TaxID=1631356 RepID=UPI000A979B34|nr:regulatory protein RecX [Luteipulveratus halotolerans]
MDRPFDRPAGPPPAFAQEAARSADGTATSASTSYEPSSSRRPTREQRRTSPGAAAQRRTGRAPEAPDDPSRAASQDPEPDAHEVARAIVLRQLTMAPRSRKQLEDKLRQKDCDEQVARQVLDRMEEVGLVDDEAYAQMVVRTQQTGRGLARRALRQELRRKGVDDEVAAATLDDIDDESERDRARALAEKKMRSMHGLDATVQTRRLAGMLARKGYSSSVAWAVIREVIADAPEHQPD